MLHSLVNLCLEIKLFCAISTVVVMTSSLSLVYVSIWRHMFFFGLIYSIVVCSGLAFYSRDIGGTFSRTEIGSLFSVFIFYEDIDLCCVFMLVTGMPSCCHFVLEIYSYMGLLTELEVQCGLGNPLGIRMFFHDLVMKCSSLDS